MIIAFSLSMPGVASWNGKWSGERELYAVTRTLKKAEAEKILENPRYSYAWDDGWRAAVTAQHVDSKKAAKIRKKSKGFCGYEWMIDSIITHQEIID